jgi:hypothetical protein
MWRCRAAAAAFVLAAVPLAAQQTPSAPPRTVVAVAVTGAPPHVDGRLDEPIWAQAQPAAGFTLREPTEGVPAPERTEVRFVYTADALYVGARMFSDAPAKIRRLVARRDREPPSERLIISLDTRGDRRTAYSFGITPGGVRIDYFHDSDFEDARDYSYDPVWEATTRVDSLGWVAEMRIPFAQLRYNPGPTQVWGVNLLRLVPDRNEEAYWILVARNETGWSSRMGRLEGMAGLPATRRIELLPYVAGNTSGLGGDQDAAAETRAGADLKMGLGPNVTLEGTFNPDFGQVDADPAEVNLSAYETFFEERRPFFLEGADLLGGGRGNFYSRRIGSSPDGREATILGAVKVTGRLPSGLALGALTAVTNGGAIGPHTGYAIVTARQEVGRDRSTIAATLTAVERDLEDASLIASLVPRRALTGLLDGRWRWDRGRYDMSAFLGTSYVTGSTNAMVRLQRAPQRYYQRPDAQHVDVDSSRTSLTGVLAGINHSKLAGNWRWDIDYVEERPGLELNDMGALGSADDRGLFWDFWYRGTKPSRTLQNWTTGFFQGNEWNFDGDRKFTEAGVWWDGTLRGSFLRPSAEISTRLRAVSDDQTRGGPLMTTPSNWTLELALRSRSAARTAWDLELAFARNELGGEEIETEARLAFRPGPQWEVSIEPGFSRELNVRQYVARVDTGGPVAAYGGRYIFARLARNDFRLQLRAAVALTADLTIEAYLEPFATSGQYTSFGELVAARSHELRVYDTGGTTLTRSTSNYDVTDGPRTFSFPIPDFDVRSLRSNFVVRWEWRPGSTIFFVWQQNRDRNDGIPARSVGPGGLFQAFDTEGTHYLALKVSYWIAVR